MSHTELKFTANVSSLLSHLENTQWWPPDVLRRHQLKILMPLVAHGFRTVPWYRRRFDELRIPPDEVADEKVWQSLPVLTRTDIQDAGTDLHSTEIPREHGRVSKKWTGGSTATPVMVLSTELTARFWVANTLREYRWQGSNLKGKLAVIRYLPRGAPTPPNGTRLSNWGIATSGRINTGPCAVLSVKSKTSEQANRLLREQPDYLQTYPSVALSRLAEHFLSTGQRLLNLRHVYTYGEVVEAKVHQACRRAWDADVLDSYSTSEVGHVAIQCAEGGVYHVQSEHLLVELLDDHDQQCSTGQLGRVVITDLFNYAMPILRYDIGDYAESAAPCSCGRKLPTLRKLLAVPAQYVSVAKRRKALAGHGFCFGRDLWYTASDPSISGDPAQLRPS